MILIGQQPFPETATVYRSFFSDDDKERLAKIGIGDARFLAGVAVRTSFGRAFDDFGDGDKVGSDDPIG
jgi:hypothetical protein